MPSPLTSSLQNLPAIFIIIAFSLFGLIFFAFILSDCMRRWLHPSPTSRGLDKRALNSLPKLIFSQASASVMDYKLEECAICLSQFEEGEEIRVLPQCGHGYHVVCIDTWLGSHSTCPSCRQIPLSVFDTCQKCMQSSGDRRLPEVAIEASVI